MSRIDLSARVHKTAIVSEGAVIGPECMVGPYTVVAGTVRMGARNNIGPHVVIEGRTTLGDENTIFQFASVGSNPQDLKYKGEPSELIIGHRNIVREYATLQPGTEGGGMKTSIGNDNLFMVGSHVGHDAVIGDANVIANYASLAGHVVVGSRITLGGLSGVHQFVRLGDLCILGAGSMVAQDIPPFCMGHGDHAALVGLNHVGLKRVGVSSEQQNRLRILYREVFSGGGRLVERVARLKDSVVGFPFGEQFLDYFMQPSQRGIAYPRRKFEQTPSSD